MKLPHRVESLDELKELATNRRVHCYIELAGGIARSSKMINYYKGNRRPWDIFESISDSWIECTDKTLARDTMIVEAIEAKALVVEGFE